MYPSIDFIQMINMILGREKSIDISKFNIKDVLINVIPLSTIS